MFRVHSITSKSKLSFRMILSAVKIASKFLIKEVKVVIIVERWVTLLENAIQLVLVQFFLSEIMEVEGIGEEADLALRILIGPRRAREDTTVTAVTGAEVVHQRQRKVVK